MESSKGKRSIDTDGYFGKEKIYLNPIPPHPKTIIDKWGNKWLYIGKTDDEFARVAKALPNGSVDIATLHHMPYAWFPCFQE